MIHSSESVHLKQSYLSYVALESLIHLVNRFVLNARHSNVNLESLINSSESVHLKQSFLSYSIGKYDSF